MALLAIALMLAGRGTPPRAKEVERNILKSYVSYRPFQDWRAAGKSE